MNLECLALKPLHEGLSLAKRVGEYLRVLPCHSYEWRPTATGLAVLNDR
jgi:hypothetical protein